MEERSGGQRGWENLPPEILLSIAGCFGLPDIARARGVCRHWAVALRKESGSVNPKPRTTYPFLVLSNEQGELSESCTLLSLPERRCYRVSPLPEIRNRRFIGSKGNWLVTLNLALEPHLLNPFTREEARLPSLIDIPDPEYKSLCVRYTSTWVGFYYQPEQPPIPYPINLFRDLCIRKIVPSSDNGPAGIVVVAYGLTTVRLALARPGDSAWTLAPLPLLRYAELSDVVYNANDGRFYAVTTSGAVFFFYPDNPQHATIISNPYNMDPFFGKIYLVFSSDDDLLLVHRLQQPRAKFWVFKINMKGEQGDLKFLWRKPLDHLNGRCLMLGTNHSVSLSPQQVSGLKENCIYFTDDYRDDLFMDYRDHPHDVGVFDMKLGKIDPFLTDYSNHTWPPPIWFLPSLHMY